MKATRVASLVKVSLITRLALFAAALMCGSSIFAATPYPLSSGNYSEGFDDIANWTDNFAAGNGASRWGSVAINATGTIPDGSKTTAATDTFKTGTSGGVQRGTAQSPVQSNIVLLATGATDNSAALAIDLYLDFTGVTAGTLSFDWNEINNSTGNRAGTVKVYTTTDGTTFTELAGASVTCTNNTAGSGTVSGVALPTALNNNSTARIRFYYYNGGTGPASPSGSRPKIGIDNVVVTGSGGGSTGFVRVETKADGTGLVVPAQNVLSGSSLTVYAIQRDASSNFVANIPASSWSLTGVAGGVTQADLVASGDLKSATFTAHVAGAARIQATAPGLSAVNSGSLTVTAGTPTQVRVETAADGSGSVVPAQTVISGQAVTMYAVRRDTYSNFVDNVAASTWSLPTKTGAVLNTDLVPSGDLKSAIFTGNGQGTTTVRATSTALTAFDSGLLTITSLPPSTVVISQVYGGGGNSGATYQNDYVELFNRSASPVSLNGWSIQYASSTGAFNSGTVAALPNVSIAAYSYYLISLNTNGTIGVALPTPDLINTNLNLSGTAGKVALANTTTALGALTWPDVRVLDLVAYGASTPFEGTGAAPTLSATTAAARANSGCTDTDNNGSDFTALNLSINPPPHNSSSGQNVCSSQTPPTISVIANQSADASGPIGPISFDVNDAQTPAANLTVSATSSNPTLLPNNQITFGGSGIVRNVTLSPAAGQTGSSFVTITVTDSDNMTAQSSFYVFVGGGPALGILFNDNFDAYADGTSLSAAPVGSWFHSSGTNYELIVSNKAAQVSLYLTNSEDIYVNFATGPYTVNSGDVLYYGFTLNQTSLPGVNGDYFVHLRDANGTNFVAKLFASTGNAASGKFRLGLSNRANNPPNVQYPADLSLNTTYNVVVRYKVGVGSSTLWVNPTSPSDNTGVTATDSLTPFDVAGFGIRESGSPTTPTTAGSQVVDNLVVSTSMSDVTTFPILAPTISATRSGNAITLTWPTANNSAFVLQTATTVNATTWNAVNGVTVSGNNYTVTVPLSSTAAFFRLKQ